MTYDLNFNSQFADGLRGFILEKRGLGCKYKAEAATLRLFDEYVCSSGYEGLEISKELFEGTNPLSKHFANFFIRTDS